VYQVADKNSIFYIAVAIVCDEKPRNGCLPKYPWFVYVGKIISYIGNVSDGFSVNDSDDPQTMVVRAGQKRARDDVSDDPQTMVVRAGQGRARDDVSDDPQTMVIRAGQKRTSK
jgi:hypothetical protein